MLCSLVGMVSHTQSTQYNKVAKKWGWSWFLCADKHHNFQQVDNLMFLGVASHV